MNFSDKQTVLLVVRTSDNWRQIFKSSIHGCILVTIYVFNDLCFKCIFIDYFCSRNFNDFVPQKIIIQIIKAKETKPDSI